jgi:hypothetical protein
VVLLVTDCERADVGKMYEKQTRRRNYTVLLYFFFRPREGKYCCCCFAGTIAVFKTFSLKPFSKKQKIRKNFSQMKISQNKFAFRFP